MASGERAAAAGDVSGEHVDRESLEAAFAGTDTCRHLALFYRSRAEQFAAVTAYVERGLRRDERVLYVADDNETETIRDWLREADIEVDRLEDSGQLVVVDSDEVYAGETFDPVESAEEFETFAGDAMADGYTGIRAAGENTWSFGLDCEFETVMEFETVFDDRVDEMEATALCQYSLEQFSEAEIGKALQTHEEILYRGEICENPYYVSPSEALDRGTPLSNATLLLEQTRDIDGFRRDVESREQRLSVINRVLRHNLRNDVNVIHGRLEWLTEHDQVPDSGPVREQLDTLADTADRLATLSEKARHVDRTLESVDRQRAELNARLSETVDTVTDTDPGASVELERGPADATVADGAVGVAVREVLLVATERLSDPDVTVTFGTDDVGLATITVTTDEPFATEATGTAIERGREEALQHASGLGLWVAQWILDRINGSLDLGSGPVDRVEITAPLVAN